jgi:hypothetical protein
VTEDQTIYVADRTTPMTKVMDLIGWQYRDSLPCQIPCPVHKDGTETSRSARLHEDGLFCFTCNKQYLPTEVFSARLGGSRFSAAEKLLVMYPPSPEELKSLQNGYTAPKIKPVNSAIEDHLEAVLLEHRHKVPFTVYRRAARELDESIKGLVGLSDDDQLRRVRSIKAVLHKRMTEKEEVAHATPGNSVPDSDS